MMDVCDQIFYWIIFLICFVVLIYAFAKVVICARKGYKWAIVLGALLAIFAPDPIYEKSCKSVQKAKQRMECTDESGDPPLP